MGGIAIRAEGLGKRYRIGQLQRYKALRDTMAEAFAAPFRRLRALGRSSDPNGGVQDATIWALKDVSFEIPAGAVVGIIGRNGAGKSTLLKVLSRITEPTEGCAEIAGRVGSLLEVGTGFHPELTGRENVFLNGAILGMRRGEIERKFDEIVAFAEVEKFVDTPTKFYSSGMYLRLGFAVAAHLEPEILLVDEVLAVGDVEFQRKCLGKMSEVAHQGRTVLFVSHNLAAVQSLCERACLLEAGRLARSGPAGEVIKDYLESLAAWDTVPLDRREDRAGDGSVRIRSIRIESADADRTVRTTSRLRVNVEYKSDGPLRYARFLVGVYDQTSVGIFLLDSEGMAGLPDVLPAEGTVTCVTDPINLTPGRCIVNVAVIKAGRLADHIQYAAHIDVEGEHAYGLARLPERSWMMCVLPQTWSLDGHN